MIDPNVQKLKTDSLRLLNAAEFAEPQTAALFAARALVYATLYQAEQTAALVRDARNGRA